MRAHPAADLFPMMSDDALAALAKDIVNHGQYDPIVVISDPDGLLILDGRNRYAACQRLGIQPKTTVWKGDDPIAFVWSKNAERRHLTDSQKAMIGERFATMKRNDTLQKGRQSSDAPAGASGAEYASQESAAKLVGVSRRLIQRARAVRTNGVPELVAAVQSGDVSVTAAAEVVSLPREEQRRLVASGSSAIVERANRREPKHDLAPKFVIHDGGLMEETHVGVLQQAKQKLYDLSVQPPKWRTHLDRHEEVRKHLAKGMRVGEIVAATGFDEHFVHHSMAPYRIRPKVMANVISDTQVTAETWASWARRIEQKWPGATRQEKDQLIEQLEACRRSAGAFIRELNKEARIEGETA